MSTDAVCYVFTEPNQSGRGNIYGVEQPERYTILPPSTMIVDRLFLDASSAKVFASSRADATLILFSYYHPESPYEGPFLQITNERGAASDLVVNTLPAGFDNLATSMFLVAAGKGDEVRRSFRDLFLDPWRTLIDARLAGTRAERKVDPILAWEMFPEGLPPLDPSWSYLKIIQPLNINLTAWPDYAASITYHILLYVDGGGRLRGWVARWAYWVEDGIKKEEISAELEPAVVGGVSALNAEIAQRLDAIPLTFTDIYYLPGRQLERAPTGVLTGDTYEDVTIVLQR